MPEGWSQVLYSGVQDHDWPPGPRTGLGAARARKLHSSGRRTDGALTCRSVCLQAPRLARRGSGTLSCSSMLGPKPLGRSVSHPINFVQPFSPDRARPLCRAFWRSRQLFNPTAWGWAVQPSCHLSSEAHRRPLRRMLGPGISAIDSAAG